MKYIRDSCENLNAVVPILFFISLFSDFCFFYDIICMLDQASKKSKQTRKENGKRMRTKSRAVSVILSLFLVVVMLIGMTPVSAISIPNTSETTDVTSYKSEEFKVPDIIDEEEQAERAYTGRVKEDETDLYTFVFKNEDGSNTMRVFDHPVKYVNDKGETRDISLEISKDKDGSFKAADHMIKASFGNDISEGIGLEYDDIRIEMTAKAKNNVKAEAELSDEGKKLAYAVDDKTSYVYSLTYCGIKEDIVVSEYTGQTEYEFTLKTNGLHPVKIDESVFLADNDEEINASIGDIIIFTADNRNNAFGDLQFETVEENSEYKFTIVLDPDYLRDEKTAYPITIDPTIEINYDNNGAGAIEDVTINSLDTSSGSSGSIYVGLRNTYGIARILMRFPNLDLSGIALADNITSATVEMKDLLCETESMTVYCYIFNGNSWSESNVDWQTVSPNSYTTFLSSRAVSYSVGNSLNPLHRYSFSILSAVKGWKNGTADQSKGIIFKASGSVESGNTYINKTFASYNRASNKPSLSISYINLPNGTYYLKNRYYSYYAQVDDNDAPGYINNGGIMEIWPFNGETYQQWIFTHVGNGYYKITSKISGYAITVPSGQETNDNVDLVLMPYAYSDRQRWSITKTSHGSYKIKAKSSESYTDKDLVMDLQTASYSDGLNIRQREYIDNTSYKDEWYLELTESIEIDLCGILNSGHDHTSALNVCRSYLINAMYNNTNLTCGSMSGTYCKNILLTTNVFTSRSHGGAIMTVTDELVATLIQLSDSSTGDYFISHSYSGMPSGSQCILNTDSFNNLKIVLFIGCKTGYGGDGAKNLPTAITNRGAGAAVGFCESIDCTQANEWTKDFYSYLIFGYTVQESVDYASGRRSVASGLRSAFVSGNGSLYLNDN